MSLLTQIGTSGIRDSAVTTPKIADANVTTPKIDDGDITTAKLADSAVTSVKTAGIETPKNLLINGNMNVWQRATTGSVSSDDYRTADRWRTAMNSMGTFTQSRSSDVPTGAGTGFPYSLKMECTSADASPAAGDYCIIEQRFEGNAVQHLMKGTSTALSVTLSFWVKSNKTGTYIVELFDQDNSRHIAKSYTISSADTWEKKEVTFAGDTTGALDNDNAHSIGVLWWLGAGSGYSSGTLATSWAANSDPNRAVGQVNLADSTSNEFYMTGCQLEVGTIAKNFDFESYDETLRKCQRYCITLDQMTFEHLYHIFGSGNTATVQTSWSRAYPATMRAAPGTYATGNASNGTLQKSAYHGGIKYRHYYAGGGLGFSFRSVTAYGNHIVESEI